MTDMQAARLTGLIIPDLPIDDADDWIAASTECDIDPIFLVTLTSSDEKIELIGQKSRGYIFCVRLTGITGTRADDVGDDVHNLVSRIRQQSD